MLEKCEFTHFFRCTNTGQHSEFIRKQTKNPYAMHKHVKNVKDDILLCSFAGRKLHDEILIRKMTTAASRSGSGMGFIRMLEENFVILSDISWRRGREKERGRFCVYGRGE